MTTLHDFAHEGREALRDPAECEESTLDAALIEQIQHGQGVGFDAAGIIAPVRAVHSIGECLDLEIVLDIDGKQSRRR